MERPDEGALPEARGAEIGGRNPWPNDQAPGWTNAAARAAAAGRSPEELAARPIRVDVAGRVMGLRRFGKAAFLVLSDRSGRLQAYLKKDHLGEEAYDLFLKSVDAGDIVWVEGPLFLTRTGELTVEAARFRLLTKAIRPLPEKWHGLSDIETRYRQRYVDLIVNEDVREIFRRAGADRLLPPLLPDVAGLPRGRDADDADRWRGERRRGRS